MAEYAPLTQAEKEAIIARNHEIIDNFNQVLPGEMALRYDDEALRQRLDDPKEVAVYRMAQENQIRNAKRQQILDSLVNQYGQDQHRENPMARSFRYLLKLGDTPADKAYNEKLYQDYINNPEKIVYREYTKLLNINPQTLYQLGNDKQALAEFYMENTALCETAYVFQSTLENSEAYTTKTLHDAVKGMKKPFETLNALSNVVVQGGFEGLACPPLEPEQAAISMAGPMFMNKANPELNEVLYGKLEPSDTPYTFFQRVKDYGLNIDDPDFLVKYKAMRTDPETGTRKEVSFDTLLVDDDPNVRIELRSKEEIPHIRAINRTYQDKYAEKFQERIASRLNQQIFNVQQIEEDRKGGWFERNIFRNTSPEWTAFIEGFKNFNDPNHPDYLRKDILRPKAVAYMDHKKDQGFNSLEDMKGTALKRGTLCQSVIDVCDELSEQDAAIHEDIDIKINTGLNGKIGLIINAQQVDVNGDLERAPDQNQPQKEKAVEAKKEEAVENDNEIVME